MKKMFIIYEDPFKTTAEYLIQLISMNDDTADIVGTKDGEIMATAISEKELLRKKMSFSSLDYTIYIGNSKYMKEKRRHMKMVFNKFNMEYGWLGKQAYIFAEKIEKEKEYKKFTDFAKTYQEGLGIVLEKAKKKSKNIAKTSLISGIAGVSLALTGHWGLASILSTSGILNLTNFEDKERRKQQYDCAVIVMYLDSMNDFLK